MDPVQPHWAKLPSYNVKAINVGSFELGEADKVLSIFTAEKGLLKAVAKSVKKPGTKMSGRADILSVNELLLSSGRTFEIITQAQTIETFSGLRNDFVRLSYGLYYAELTQSFAQGLLEDSQEYFDYLLDSLRLQALGLADPVWLCLEFEMGLLEFLGYRPELTFCIGCRQALNDYNLSRFNVDLGGVVCSDCFKIGRLSQVNERNADIDDNEKDALVRGIHISPLVWKSLVQASLRNTSSGLSSEAAGSLPVPAESPPHLLAARAAAQKLMQNYIEHRAGKRLKSLEILGQMKL